MSTDERIVPMRLQRFLARAGVASRRGSENLMTAGRVEVNGEVVRELGSKVDPRVDRVCVDGRVVKLGQDSSYLILNKPAGYLTTMSDPYRRPCVAELVASAELPGLFPVGRLDMDTTGVLLFTTDGDLGNALLHPSRHVLKSYIACVEGKASDEELNRLREGILLDDGPCQPALVSSLDVKDGSQRLGSAVDKAFKEGTTLYNIGIYEGRKHQVKRMFEAIGHPVLGLHRISFGPLCIGELEEGSWRFLSKDEHDTLIQVAQEPQQPLRSEALGKDEL